MSEQPQHRFANRFDGKVALLTGSAASAKDKLIGFGGATVWRFLEEGGRGVVITDVQDEVGEQSARQLRDAGHDAIYMHLDVTEEQQWGEVVNRTMSHFGRLDILSTSREFSIRSLFSILNPLSGKRPWRSAPSESFSERGPSRNRWKSRAGARLSTCRPWPPSRAPEPTVRPTLSRVAACLISQNRRLCSWRSWEFG